MQWKTAICGGMLCVSGMALGASAGCQGKWQAQAAEVRFDIWEDVFRLNPTVDTPAETWAAKIRNVQAEYSRLTGAKAYLPIYLSPELANTIVPGWKGQAMVGGPGHVRHVSAFDAIKIVCATHGLKLMLADQGILLEKENGDRPEVSVKR